LALLRYFCVKIFKALPVFVKPGHGCFRMLPYEMLLLVAIFRAAADFLSGFLEKTNTIQQ
jgi:hypothetical protein